MSLKLILSITDKLLAKTPDYDQKKAQEYNDLKLAYKAELTKTYPERDDDLIMNLRDQLTTWIESFNKDLEGK